MSISFKKIAKSSRFKKVLIILSLTIVLVFGVWAYIVWTTSKEIPWIERDINAFLVLMSNEDYEKAYEMFSNKYKKEENFETFRKSILPGKDTFLEYKPNSFRPAKATRFLHPLNPSTLRYVGEISYLNGGKAEVTATFILENNDWRLYLLEVNPINRESEKNNPFKTNGILNENAT